MKNRSGGIKGKERSPRTTVKGQRLKVGNREPVTGPMQPEEGRLRKGKREIQTKRLSRDHRAKGKDVINRYSTSLRSVCRIREEEEGNMCFTSLVTKGHQEKEAVDRADKKGAFIKGSVENPSDTSLLRKTKTRLYCTMG